MGNADHVRLRNELHAQQLRQGLGIDRVGLHLRVADRLEIFRVAQVEVNPLGHQQVPEPVPHAGTLDDGLMGTGQRGEVGGDGLAVGRHVRLADDLASVVECMDGEGALVEIDAGVHHRCDSQ